jgi:glycoside/pentoside/hexuronide:cation symporter, GPH family
MSTAPEDRVPASQKAAYAAGGAVDYFGHWYYQSAVTPLFVSFLGMSATYTAIAIAVSRLSDAVTNPLFGWISDNTRSRWGRRRPYILVGGILSGLALPFMFMAQPGWSSEAILAFMIISALLYAPLISAFNMPYQSLGSEMTPDYDERTRLMSWKAVVQKLSGAAVAMSVAFASLSLFNDPETGKPDLVTGFVTGGAILGAVMIVFSIWTAMSVPERYYRQASQQQRMGFFAAFREAFTSRPYVLLLGVAMLYAIPSGLMGQLGFYVNAYYVYAGDPDFIKKALALMAWNGLLMAGAGLIGVPVANWIAVTWGKHRALLVTLGLNLVAFASTWWCYSPEYPYLTLISTALVGFAATGLWIILPAMCIDVVDYDELHSNQRREGIYSSVLSLVLKVSMGFTLLALGPILDYAAGFQPALKEMQSAETQSWLRWLFTGVPVVAVILAAIVLRAYPLTSARMAEIRAQLEARRGKV